MPLLPLAPTASSRVPLSPFVDDGRTKTHLYSPAPLRLTHRGSALTTVIAVGSRSFRVWIQKRGQEATLYVDKDQKGRWEAKDAVPWVRQVRRMADGSSLTRYQTEVSFPTGGVVSARYDLFYFESNTTDPSYARLRDGLVAVPEFGFLGKASFGGRSYRIGVRGGDLAQGCLFVDRDGDGLLGTVPAEMFMLDRPFNIDGRSYRVASFNPQGRPSIAFAASNTKVAEVPMPPDLRIGRIAPKLVSRTLAGRPLSFPGGFQGKLVMLDVWATWCGPCRAEIPYMKDAYARFKGRGFEIASFSIDDSGKQAQVARFTKAAGETWPQAFEGQGWRSPVCQRYLIDSIPFLLLVDGSTGRIMAAGDALRGPNMAPTIARALAAKSR